MTTFDRSSNPNLKGTHGNHKETNRDRDDRRGPGHPERARRGRDSAEAYCLGEGNGRSIIYRNGDGQIYAKERNISGTCDGDNIYNGQISDPLEDGYAVRVRYRDAGVTAILAYAYSESWVNYRFHDQNGDSRAGFQVWSTPDSSDGDYYYGTNGY